MKFKLLGATGPESVIVPAVPLEPPPKTAALPSLQFKLKFPAEAQVPEPDNHAPAPSTTELAPSPPFQV
jgi:hypothetical protein